MSAGDVVWVRGTVAGRTYNETPSLPISGTASQRLTLRAYSGERVVLTGSSGARLNINRDYWTIDGFVIDQAGHAADAVKINANQVVIQNCEIKNGTREGISIERTTGTTIQDCSIHDFMWIDGGTRGDAHGIIIATTETSTLSNITIQRNTIRRCSGDGTQVYGVSGQPISSYAKNISFLNNVFEEGNSTSGLTENALDFKAADGVTIRGNTMTGYINNKTIVVQKGCRNFVIEDNRIADGLSGIEMRVEGGSSFIQENHRVVGNVIHDMSSYAIKTDGVRNGTIANNTLVNIGGNSFRFELSTLSGIPSLDGGLIANNLCYSTGSPSGTSLLSGVTVGFNGWYQASAGGLSRATDVTGTNPGFVNASSKDFHLTSSSPCINRGTTLVGRPYSGAAPDLGAFEFGTAAPTDLVPPAATTDLRTR